MRTSAVVRALLQLGNCFDLMDTRFTEGLPAAFEAYKEHCRRERLPMPENRRHTPDKLLRKRDSAVLNFYLKALLQAGARPFDSVRCGFVEGAPAFEGSAIRRQSHVQIAVRNPVCVVGVFRPRMEA